MTFGTTNANTAAARSVPLVPRHDGVATRELAIEHGVLTRQMASLQRRVGEQLRAHAVQIMALEEELMHLRTQLIVSRTCLLWGLGMAGVLRPLPPRRARHALARAVAASMAEASQVICQTGCVGHAHPWLEDDGQCRRTGSACTQVGSTAEDRT